MSLVSADNLQPTTSVANTPDVPFLEVEVSKATIRKEGADRSADKVYLVTNGAILIDAAGGQGDDILTARLVGHPMSEYFNRHAGKAIRQGDVETVKREVLSTIRAGRNELDLQKSKQRINSGADTTANIALIMRSRTGETIGITANAGDSSTFLRNDLTGELRLVSQDQSFPALEVAAGKMTRQEAIGHKRRNETYLLSNVIAGLSDQELSRQVNLQALPIPSGHSLVMFSDGPTDNFHPDHLNDLSRRFAQKHEPARVFVHGVVERGRDIYLARKSSLTKKDDVSGASITPARHFNLPASPKVT